MLLTTVLVVLVTILCLFFSLLLGMKLAELFEIDLVAYAGPLVGLCIGIGFGLSHMPFAAGLAAGLIGSSAAAYVIYRNLKD